MGGTTTAALALAATMTPRAPVIASESQGVRFWIREAQFERTLDAEKGQTDRFNLHCRAQSASRKDLWLMARQVSVDEAIDETGRDLGKTGRRPLGYLPGHVRERGGWNFVIRLKMPDAPAKRIARIRGCARLLAVTKEMRISFPQPAAAQGTTRTKEGYTARLEAFRTFGENVTAKVRLKFPAGARRAPPPPRPPGPRERFIFRAAPAAPAGVPGLSECVSLVLSTADGREIPAHGGGRGGGLRQMTYVMWFPARGATVASLELVIAREGKWIEIPFEFADLLLPETRPSIVMGPRREGPAEIRFSSELFDLSLEKVTRSERLELSGRYGGIQIQGTAKFSEKQRVLAVSDFVRIDAATDDRKERLASAVDPEEELFDTVDEGEADVWMVLSGAHPEATEVASLRGMLGLWLEEERAQLTFDLKEGLPQKKISGNVTVELQGLRKEEKRGGYSLGDVVILTFMCSGLPGAEPSAWWQQPRCFLADAEGRLFESTGQSFRLLGGKMRLESRFHPRESPPARAVFEYAKKARLVWAPFELKNIPVPWARKREGKP